MKCSRWPTPPGTSPPLRASAPRCRSRGSICSGTDLRVGPRAGRFRSVEEGAVLVYDGDIDVFRAVVVGRRVADKIIAQVEILDPFHGFDESGAGRVLSASLEPFHQHLGRDKALQ